MARMLLSAVSAGLIIFLAGCNDSDYGVSQTLSDKSKIVEAYKPGVVEYSSIDEIDLIEKTEMYRQSYKQSLDMLITQYEKTGNNMKLQWAEEERKYFDRIPHYNYIVEATLAGPELKASASVSDADELYAQCLELEKRAGELVVVRDSQLLREAIEKYNLLIRRYPDSDKIDDAAFKAGDIYFYFRDYTLAALYYQRAYQWNSLTPYPARYKAAYMLDTFLARRDEALPLYQQAVAQEKLDDNQREWAFTRIADMTKYGKK